METLEQLKSKAYDALVQVEAWQQKLKEANQAIANFKEEVKDEPKTDKGV